MPSEEWSGEENGDGQSALDEESVALLADVASALPHTPRPSRRALAHEMQVWREEALRRSENRPPSSTVDA